MKNYRISLTLLLTLGLEVASSAAASARVPSSAVVSVGAVVLDCAIIAPGDKIINKDIDGSCEGRLQAPGQVRYCATERDYMCDATVADYAPKKGAPTPLPLGNIEMKVY